MIRAYRVYREHIQQFGMPEVLSITRAWRLLKFFDAGMLTLTPCTKCTGNFVIHTYELTKGYVCGLCDMPSRAGKTREAALEARRDAECATAQEAAEAAVARAHGHTHGGCVHDEAPAFDVAAMAVRQPVLQPVHA